MPSSEKRDKSILVKSSPWILLGIFIFLYFYHPLEIEDVWWHLSTGRWIAEHAAVPVEDPFPFWGRQTPWTFTQWLGSLIFYGFFKIGGYAGLKIARALLLLAVPGIFLYSCRRRLPGVISFALAVLMIYGVGKHVPMRPLIFNLMFIQLFLIRLLKFHETGRLKEIFALPVLGIVWFNLHLGSFIYGSLLIGIFLFSEIVAWLNEKLRKERSGEKSPAVTRIKHLSVVFLLYLAAFSVNPYGLKGAVYPFKVVLFPAFINFYSFNNIVAEMRPPVYLFSWSGLWFFILVALAVTAIVMNKEKRFLCLMIFLVTLFVFLYGRRGSAFFTITSVYLIADAWPAIEERLKKSAARWTGRLGTGLYVFLILWIGFQTSSIAQEVAFVGRQPKKYRPLLIEPASPARAIELLKANRIQGNVFNDDIDGGYFLWSAYPGLKPFVDGRQLDQEVFSKYVAILTDPALWWPVAEKEFDFSIALLNPADPSMVKTALWLLHDPEWKLIFIDGPRVLFVRKDRCQLSEELDSFEEKIRAAALTPGEIRRLETLAASPDGRVSWNLRYAGLFEEGLTLFDLGFREEGLRRMLVGAEVTGHPKIRAATRRAFEMFRNG